MAIVAGSLACLAQTDVKRLIAYSSVGHMGFIGLGIATMSPEGVAGALFANIASIEEARTIVNGLPPNHSPWFAPVIEPTLRTGVTALTCAARAWLAPPAEGNAG